MSSARRCPLAGKSFYLDIPRGKNLAFLAENVKRLGGVVESFLSKEVTCVVSSSQEAKGEKQAEKPTCAPLRETYTGTRPSAGFQKDSRHPSCKPLDPTLISRGKTLLHKAISKQDNIGGNSILSSARSWGVQIIHMDEMVAYIQRLSKKHPSMVKLGALGFQSPKVLRLKAHFLKIDDDCRHLCPLFKHFKDFPQLYFLTRKRHSPFVPPQASCVSKEHNSRGSASGSSPPAVGCLLPKTRKGYCERCKEAFTELHAHLKSPRHMAHATDPSHYAHVDRIISQMTNDFVAFSSTPPLRLPPDMYNGIVSGFQTEAAESMEAQPPTLGQGLHCCQSAEDPVGHRHSPGVPSHVLENQGIPQPTEQPLEVLSPPVSPVLPSREPALEPHDGDQTVAETAPRTSPPAGSEPDAVPQQPGLQAEPPPAPRKRRLSSSPLGPVKKRRALASEGGQRGAVLLPEERPQVDATEGCPFGKLSGGQAAPRHPGQSAGRSHTSSLCAAPSHLSPEGPPGLLCKPVAIDTDYLTSPGQQPKQGEVPALHPYKARGTFQHGNFPGPPVGSGSSPDLPTGKHTAPELLGSAVHCSSPGTPETNQVGLPEQRSPGPASCLPLASNPPTCLCADETSSSSALEWDGPLLGVLAGASRRPSRGAVDAALLGARVSLADSDYAPRLCSVLQRAPEQCWPTEGDLGCDLKSHVEMERAPFTAVQACGEN